MVITSESELRTAYRKPNERAEQKVLGWLDNHSRKFIAISPFCVISSFGADGRADTSPRGDPPGVRGGAGRTDPTHSRPPGE